MQIKIVDSWLREFLDTEASPSEIAKQLSLTSVSVDRTDKVGDNYVYDIEVTTNRPDLMSVIGIAKEAAALLPEQRILAKFTSPKKPDIQTSSVAFPIDIKSDPKLVNRICAVVMEVEIGQSPKNIRDRLEMSGIRSLNNLIDVTNYVMREVGHPCHVFDYDLLTSKKIIIRESKKGEIITTLDGKEYRLYGGDIVADDGTGQIIDLLGIMGTQNSVVQDDTKRILFFLDNNNPKNIRRTSMSLGIRTEAAIINEKGIDPELMMPTLQRGIELYQKIAKGKVISQIFDDFPNKPKTHMIKVSIENINSLIGVKIEPHKSIEILERLGFKVRKANEYLEVESPTIRPDVQIDEDVIEEIARVWGYYKLPSVVPSFLNNKNVPYANQFYFEERVKNAFKYWGYTETYTYSLISEDLYDGPIENAVKLKNPLSEDMEFLRNSLVPSLLTVAENNKSKEELKIFELANTYHKKQEGLPVETLTLSGLIKKQKASFFEVKGLIEQFLEDLGIRNYKFKNRNEGAGADVFLANQNIGYIEILNDNLINFEINFDEILKHTNIKKAYKPLTKFPPVVEDLTFVLDENIKTEEIITEIKLQSSLIAEVTLIDQFEFSKTFHIFYQSQDRNLTKDEVSKIREGIIKTVSAKFSAKVK